MCPSLNHHCSQGDGTCGLARLWSHGSGTGLDLYDLSLGEGWVLKESTDVDAKRRKTGCWVGASPDGILEKPRASTLWPYLHSVSSELLCTLSFSIIISFHSLSFSPAVPSTWYVLAPLRENLMCP